MAKIKSPSVRFRDTKTGRIVSKSTWKRSKAQGGTRYKREIIKKGRKKKPPKPVKNREYLLVFEYPRVKRSAGFHVDVFVIGPDGSKINQLIDIIQKYIDDPWWLEIAIEAYIEAEGELTNEKETAEERSFIRI